MKEKFGLTSDINVLKMFALAISNPKQLSVDKLKNLYQRGDANLAKSNIQSKQVLQAFHLNQGRDLRPYQKRNVCRINHLRSLGFTKKEIEYLTGLSRPTVQKYYNTLEEYYPQKKEEEIELLLRDVKTKIPDSFRRYVKICKSEEKQILKNKNIEDTIAERIWDAQRSMAEDGIKEERIALITNLKLWKIYKKEGSSTLYNLYKRESISIWFEMAACGNKQKETGYIDRINKKISELEFEARMNRYRHLLEKTG